MATNKLTIVEKRVLEKYISNDISDKNKEIESKIREQELKVSKELEQNPPSQVKKLAENYFNLYQETKKLKDKMREIEKEQDKTENELDKLGYRRIERYDRESKSKAKMTQLQVLRTHPKLRHFDKMINQNYDKIQKLKRDFEIKVYSETGSMESILAELQATLNKL